MKDPVEPFGPSLRPDSAPIHPNKIRAFREELRLSREQFSELIDANVDTERGWETGVSIPRGEAALKIIELAKKNWYPLTLEDILIKQEPEKRRKRRKNHYESNKSRQDVLHL